MNLFDTINQASRICWSITPFILIGYIFYSAKIIRKYARMADKIVKRQDSSEANFAERLGKVEDNQKLMNTNIEDLKGSMVKSSLNLD